MENAAEFIKFLDFFGTRFTFYTNNYKRYYTTFGGILTIISIIFCIVSFCLLASEDFKRKTPITLLTSNVPQKPSLISLEKEKIWIPWRIVDSEGNYINHTGKIIPVISYNYAKRNNKKESFRFIKRKVDYILCNETIKDIPSEYNLEINLETLYCFNIQNLEVGGDRNQLFFNYIEINLYLCEKEDKKKCNIYRNEINSLEIEVYYPEVYFISDNRKNPFSIIYKPLVYSLNSNNKVNILYFRKTTLFDDQGLFKKSLKFYSYWGGDSKTDKSAPLINNEDSKIFSFKILINNNSLQYNRSYKKIHKTIFEFFPVIYLFYIIFKLITKYIKASEENKKLIELLFESLIIKKDKLQDFIQKHFENNSINNKSNNNISKVKNNQIRHIPSNLSPLKQKPQIEFSPNRKRKSFIYHRGNNNHINLIFRPSKDSIQLSPNLPMADKKSNIVSVNDNSNSFLSNSAVNQDKKNNNNNSNNVINTFSLLNNLNIEPKVKITNTSFLFGSKNKDHTTQSHSFMRSKLFSYKYYFFLIFFQKLDISKKKFCFPTKFIKANLFLGQLLDISSYLSLQKEFQVLKNHFLTKDEMSYIEKNKKININSHSFDRNINECIGHQNLHILGDSEAKNYVSK